ncbi:hypothetical protein ASPBRDRAFT_49647 [Aspergillus brasiliensis CBS 101740]|uniref:RING-type domain-containing protein n=1 Tax=Aspergillus brasiliensis (strain CBS 101740 / IMI 381727 / IBT 21946) TaxID=767769 RepID=A0A1L9U1Q9_ASPBC|nr:hypothetical protein ASPBRDRAFT_49647 [Aspergillus brasiliensis CBS 101740]
MMNDTQLTNTGEEWEDTALAKLVIICCIIFYIAVATLVTSRLWDCIKQYPRLILTGIDYPYIFTETREQMLKHLDEAAPIKSLQNWQASWCNEGSPLLSRNDPITCAVCLEEVLKTQPVRCLECRHVFHCWCLEKWFLRFHNTCPMCHRAICLDVVLGVLDMV